MTQAPLRPDAVRPDPVRVAIVAQALAVRLGLRALLQAAQTIEVTGEAASLPLVEADLGEVDVLVIYAPEAGLETLAQVPPPPAVLLLTDTPQSVQALWDHASAWGVLSVDASAEELEAAVLALGQGLWVGDPYLLNFIQPADSPAGPPVELPDGQSLTSRELEVLHGLSQGLPNKQISLALGISEHTVKFHVSAIYTKLGASNRTEAVRLGVQRGLITL